MVKKSVVEVRTFGIKQFRLVMITDCILGTHAHRWKLFVLQWVSFVLIYNPAVYKRAGRNYSVMSPASLIGLKYVVGIPW